MAKGKSLDSDGTRSNRIANVERRKAKMAIAALRHHRKFTAHRHRSVMKEAP
jgi:hypothetical protein